VSENTSPACWYGLSDQALSAATNCARKRWPGLPACDRKGMTGPFWPGGSKRGWPLRLFGATSLAPVAVPTRHRLAVEKEMGTASVRRGRSPARRRTGRPSPAGQQTDRRAASATGPGRGPERGARAGGRHLGDAPKPPANGRPPGATSTSLAVAQAASILLTSPTPRQALALSTVWVGLRSISTCLGRCGDPTSGAATAPNSPRNANAVPRPWIWPAGPDGVLSPQRQPAIYGPMTAGPWNCGCSREGTASRPGLQACPRSGLLPCSWRRRGSGQSR